MRSAPLLCAIAIASSLSAPAFADDPDPWLGRDKALHFAAGAAIAGGGYAVGTAIFEGRTAPALLGAGLGVGASAAKEAWDATGHGDPSWRDFTWGAIGAAAGVAIAWGIDVAIHGSGGGTATGGVIRF